jgi:sodium transport system permease protein
MLQHIKIVFRTTWMDQSRDRRALSAAFLYSLFGPFLMLGMFSMMAKAQDVDTTIRLAVIGAEHAPTLVGELERSGIQVERRKSVPGLGEPNSLPENIAGAQALLVVPADFTARFTKGEMAKVMLYRDDRSRASVAAAQRLDRHLQEYGSSIVQSRLTGRGLAAETMMPISVKAINISSSSGKAMIVAGSMLAFFVMAPFLTSMTTAIDVTAGERERQSLKPLLAQPVHRLSLVLGKCAVPAAFGVLGTIGTAVMGFVVLRFAPLDKLGVGLSLDASTVAKVILVLLPLAVAVAAAQAAVAMLANSFKEAQTYIQLLTLAPTILLFMTALTGEPGPVSKLLPVSGHGSLLSDLFTDGTVDARQALGVTAITIVICIACLALSVRQLRDEKLLAQL